MTVKISALPEVLTAQVTDILPIVRPSLGTTGSKKITVGNIFAAFLALSNVFSAQQTFNAGVDIASGYGVKIAGTNRLAGTATVTNLYSGTSSLNFYSADGLTLFGSFSNSTGALALNAGISATTVTASGQVSISSSNGVRQTVEDSFTQLVGGASTTAARLLLFGAAHATLPVQAFIDSNLLTLRNGGGAAAHATWSTTTLAILSSTAATSPTAAALTVAGGIGVAGAGYFGAGLNCTTLMVSQSTAVSDISLGALLNPAQSGGNRVLLGIGKALTTDQAGWLDYRLDLNEIALGIYGVGEQFSVGKTTTTVRGTSGLAVLASTVSTDTLTGCAVFAGGIGVAGAGNFGGTVRVGANALVTSTGDLGVARSATAGAIYFGNSNTRYIYFNGNEITLKTPGDGTCNIPSTAAANSTSTGALVVAGGLGVAKASYFGDDVYNTKTGIVRFRSVSDTVSFEVGAYGGQSQGFVSTVSNHPIVFYTNATERGRITAAGEFQLLSTADVSLSSNGGASFGNASKLISLSVNGSDIGISGGGNIGVKNNGASVIYLGNYSSIHGGAYDGSPTIWGATGLKLGASGVLAALMIASNGDVSISSTTASTSPTTGALTVAGGLGVNGAIFAKSLALINTTQTSLVIGSNVTYGSSVIEMKGALNVYNWLIGVSYGTGGGLQFSPSDTLNGSTYNNSMALVIWSAAVASNSTALVSLGGGVVDVYNGINYRGSQILGARKTGWTTQTGAVSRADLGAAPTITQLANFCRAMYADLAAHGIIGN